LLRGGAHGQTEQGACTHDKDLKLHVSSPVFGKRENLTLMYGGV
jgi:hypothetical protein